jgi:hypothetical protein
MFAGRNGKREGKGRGGGGFYTPSPEYSRYSFKTRSIRGKPGNSGKSRHSGVNPDTPASQGQHPRKDPCECVGAKVSLIGFVLATRAPVRLLEDTFPIPLYSKAFLGLKLKNIKINKPSWESFEASLPFL